MASQLPDGHKVTVENVELEAAKHSQTAQEYINEQLSLEADAKEILPYKFDKCTYILGPQRQSVFACLTCNPPPASPAQVYTPAGLCYACSISCHGDHNLVELFTKRNFVCDCGTTRMPCIPCVLRSDPDTGAKGVSGQRAAEENVYNHNFQNKFCGCGQEYDPETEKGTMYQCLGLGTTETGGCGEDWWHPHCLMGLEKDWPDKFVKRNKGTKSPENLEEEDGQEAPVPIGFPDDGDFDILLCYKCVESNPWIKRYANTESFLPALPRRTLQASTEATSDRGAQQPVLQSLKRKASDDENDADDGQQLSNNTKRVKDERQPQPSIPSNQESLEITLHKHERLPAIPEGVFSLLMKKDFREQLCHCPKCFSSLIPHPQLQEEEEEYQPSISDSELSVVGGGSGTRSHGTGSLLDRGEAALNTMDRVRAIEGVMVYNHLKDKVKEFLKPYAQSGQAVGAEDIKAYFEKLRGDDGAIKAAGERPNIGGEDDDKGDGRREQSGY